MHVVPHTYMYALIVPVVSDSIRLYPATLKSNTV